MRVCANRAHCWASPNAVRDYLRLQLAELDHEIFGILWLDNGNCLIDYDELFRGTLGQVSVLPREVVKQALERNAAAAILVHNTPSGNAESSRADELLTQELKRALAMVDVKVADHFIVAKKETLSFAEKGLLDAKPDAAPAMQAQTEQSVNLEDDEFTAENGLYKVDSNNTLAAKNQLTARLAQLDAMLQMVIGDGIQTFTCVSAGVQEDYLWGCAMMAQECRQLARMV
jgi:DNA repair protein RadC